MADVERLAPDVDGELVSIRYGDGERSVVVATTLAKGITSGLRAAMEKDPKVVLMGEDIGKLGGVFRVTDGLQKDFGEDRVFDTPLAESGIVGTAIGLAMRGYRPVCEIQFWPNTWRSQCSSETRGPVFALMPPNADPLFAAAEEYA